MYLLCTVVGKKIIKQTTGLYLHYFYVYSLQWSQILADFLQIRYIQAFNNVYF